MANFNFCAKSLPIYIFGLLHLVAGDASGRNQNPDFRLPRTLFPISYRLEIISVLDDISQYPRFTAPGRAWIQLNCTQATNVIKFHVLDLVLDTGGIEVRDSAGQPLPIQGFEVEAENDFFVVNLGSTLTPGETFELFVPYTAPISATRLDGIYLDSYIDPANNETKYVSTTLFAANNARRAFPCWDEPDFKAVFEISLGRHAKYHALSNTHLVQTDPLPQIPGWFLDTFAPSPVMSSYLVAMIVSDLTFEEAAVVDPNDPIHRVYAPYYFIDRGGGAYSANLSRSVNSGFETYYGIPYPMSKLDNVALPQFYYNAMENWGLMTYADRVLLYFEGETSAQQKYQLSLTVSHEVSHNFFGNIVTAKWWTWIWLNEGWATFVAHQGLEMTYPELRPWEMFIPEIYQPAMRMDESVNTHPVANEPLTPGAVGGVYDDIVYEKAASLIRMMQDFVTERILQEGMRRYLQKWQFGVTEQDDLFLEIQESLDDLGGGALLPSEATIKGIMDTWTLQSGYPLVTVWRASPTQVTFSQRQFVRNAQTTGDEVWWIPVNIEVLTGPSPGRRTIWMSPSGGNATLDLGEGELFFVNPESIGYFRTMYGKDMLEKLGQLLDDPLTQTTLTPVMRAKLLDDAFALAFSGDLSIQTVLDLTKYLNQEDNFIVWKTVGKSLIRLGNQLRDSGDKAGDLFQDYVLHKIKRSRESLSERAESIPLAYVTEELDKLSRYFGSEGQKVIDSVEEEVDRILKPDVTSGSERMPLPRYESEFEFGAHALGKNSTARKTTWNVLRKRLTFSKKTSERNALISLFDNLCPYGNTEDDLFAVQQIQQVMIADCVDTIKKNIIVKTKLGPLVKAWVIKR